MIFFKPPQELNAVLYDIHKTTERECADTFKNFYKRKWNSHIRIYGDRFYESDVTNILKSIKGLNLGVAKIDCVFEEILNTDEFSAIQVSPNNTGLFHELNGKIYKTLKDIRTGYIRKKYRINWDKYTKEEQQRILKTGNVHVWNPHISIASSKLPVNYKKRFPELLKFMNYQFSINEFWVEVCDLNYKHKMHYGPFQLKA